MLPAEPLIRLAAFAAVLALMALWEWTSPRRPLSQSRRRRWPGNLGLVAVDTVLVRVLFPAGAVGAALLAEARGWGFFNAVAAPGWLTGAASVVLLDLVIFGQHVLFHRVPVLWRLHRVHHADLDFDVTTGLRFHPVEIGLSMLIKVAAVLAIGAPAAAVLVFEVLLNTSSMFTHGNVRLPRGLDRAMRWLLVTPEMHRVHHSIIRRETDSNFGFNLSIWDRLFRTYRAQPKAGHEGMAIGIGAFRDARELALHRLLLQPLRRTYGA